MSFGFAIGDFIAVGRLAWEVFKAYKEAPKSFQNIQAEVLSLHAVLKEVEESISARPVTPAQLYGLGKISKGCSGVLVELQELMSHYNSLDSDKKLSWQRFGWARENILEYRSRLIAHTTYLNTFLSVLPSTVERHLETLLKRYKHGSKEPSVVSAATVDSLSREDRSAWDDIGKELEDVGITRDAIAKNKPLILDWFRNAIETGVLEGYVEKPEDMVSQDSNVPQNDNPRTKVQNLTKVSDKTRRALPKAKEPAQRKGRSLPKADEPTSNEGRISPRPKRPAYKNERRSLKTEEPTQEEGRRSPEAEETPPRREHSNTSKLFGQFLGTMAVELWRHRSTA